jgi:hypothetical protein
MFQIFPPCVAVVSSVKCHVYVAVNSWSIADCTKSETSTTFNTQMLTINDSLFVEKFVFPLSSLKIMHKQKLIQHKPVLCSYFIYKQKLIKKKKKLIG